MKRDFSDASYQQLLSLVNEVENEKWCDLTDWFGDRWYDFESWIGKLDIKKYITDVNSYHKKVIDKNNYSADKIKEIFEAVNDVSTRYKSRYVAILADLREYKNTLNMLSDYISPNNGDFNSEYIGKGLKDAVNQYLDTSNALIKISDDGMNREEAKNMDQSKLQRILDTYAATLLENIPNVNIGEMIEIPIGLGVSVYYKVDAEINGNKDSSLNLTIEDQKVQLKEFGYGKESDGLSASVDNEGKVTIEGSGEGKTTQVFLNDGFSYSDEKKIGLNTYSYTYTLRPHKPEVSIEESVKTEVEGGSVASTIGIKYSDEPWEPLPVPVPSESPYTFYIPDFDVNWAEIGGFIVVGGIIVGVVLIPFTGGASTILCFA